MEDLFKDIRAELIEQKRPEEEVARIEDAFLFAKKLKSKQN